MCMVRGAWHVCLRAMCRDCAEYPLINIGVNSAQIGHWIIGGILMIVIVIGVIVVTVVSSSTKPIEHVCCSAVWFACGSK